MLTKCISHPNLGSKTIMLDYQKGNPIGYENSSHS